ncbi:hypothetical protein N0V95_009102 [Ascochyta clinopodiicola]|nr:hypothetical protein N0V95_009102 [Ascochyta clinopodiicola]
MQFEMPALPYAYSQPMGASLYSLHNHSDLVYLSYDLIRLQQEKNVLSKGLADCVTYLKALREKQANNACRINTVPSAQKKEKKMQQTRRHLDNEIKNRKRDEEAFLSNLQTCEANIFLTNMKAYHMSNTPLHATELASTPTLYASTLCSYSGSETTDLTWDGWTDEAAISPFQKRSSNSFFVDDVAPDACLRYHRHDSIITQNAKPLPLSRDAIELPDSYPVSPNTAQSLVTCPSMLSAAAPVFEPSPGASLDAQLDGDSAFTLGRLSGSRPMAASCVELFQKRRYSATDIIPPLQHFSIDTRLVSEHLADRISRSTTPQQSLHVVTRPQMSRQRTNSL